MKSLILFGGFWVLLGSAEAGEVSIAAVVAGDEAARAGVLQSQIEGHLATLEGLALRSGRELAEAWPVEEVALGAEEERALAMMAAAAAAYYEDRTDDVEEVLDALDTLLRSHRLKKVTRAQLFVWRAAVDLARGKKRPAAKYARRALILAPELAIDLKVFRPSVGELFERVRARLGDRVELALHVWPEHAELTVDGRSAAKSPVRVFEGQHLVAASAPGFRSIERAVDVRGPIEVRLALPLALDGEPLDRSVLEKLGVDCLVAVTAGNTTRGSIWCRDRAEVANSPELPATDEGDRALLEWLASALPTTSVAGEPPEEPSSDEPSAWSLRPSVAFTTAWRASRLQSTGRGRITSQFSGPGARAALELAGPHVVGELAFCWTTYQMSWVQVALPDGSREKIAGGQSIAATIGVAYQFVFADHAWLRAGVGGSWLEHLAEDVDGRGIFPSYRHLGMDIFVRTQVPLAVSEALGGSIALTAGGVVTPVSAWSEDPTNASGTNPDADLAFRWHAGVGLFGPWLVHLGYRGEMKGASFSGVGSSPHEPALVAAIREDVVHLVVLSAGRSF